ncbi:endogenous retrovirus group PABLB member 1 Env polyprotein-like [Lissotriton helveticus]
MMEAPDKKMMEAPNKKPTGTAGNTHYRNPRTDRLHSSKTIALFITILFCFLLMTTLWILEEHAPAHETFLTTAQPTTMKDHYLISLSPQLRERRKEFWNNSFVQLLHQHNLATNTTNCWICGLLPHATGHSIPFIPSPFSVHGSCLAWLILLQESYTGNATSSRTAAHSSHGAGRNKTKTHFCPLTPSDSTQMDIPAKERIEMQVFNNPTRPTFSYLRKRTAATLTVALSVINVTGHMCVEGLGTQLVGRSACRFTRTLDSTDPPSFVSSPNMYFICGTKAYTWLPKGWGGTCYISFVLPPTYVAPANHHRQKRAKDIEQADSTGAQFLDAMKGLVPLWGPMANSRAIRHLTQAVETTMNITAGIFANNTAELQAVRLVALQNRLVLDVVLADRGGACRIIGSSCCTYIPDNSPSVYKAIEHLHRLSSEVHQEQEEWSLGGWFWDTVKSWGWRLLTIIMIPVVVICGLCLGIQCLPPMCSLCASCIFPKTVDFGSEHMRALYDTEVRNLMKIDIE